MQIEDQDLKELLEEVSFISYSILDIYNELIKVMLKEPLDQEKYEILISSLRNAKFAEEDLYEYFKNGPLFLINAINILSREEKTKYHQMNEFDRLVYRRIIDSLHNLLMEDNTLSTMGNIAYQNDPKYKYLLECGISEEDATYFYHSFIYNYNKSLANRYLTTINEHLKKTDNLSERNKLLKIKLYTIFVKGHELEDELMQNHFRRIKSSLDEEIKPSFGIRNDIKDEFLNLWTLTGIKVNLDKLQKMTMNNNLTLELLMEYQTFLLYLNDDNLLALKKYLLGTKFKDIKIKAYTIMYIDNIKQDKKIHQEKGKNILGG